MMSRTAWPSSGPSACHEMQAVSGRSSRGKVPPSPAWPAGVYLAMTDDAEPSQSIGPCQEWLGRPRSRQTVRSHAGPLDLSHPTVIAQAQGTWLQNENMFPVGEDMSSFSPRTSFFGDHH